MEKKVLPATFAYYRTVKTTLKDLDQYVGSLPMELMKNAAEEGYKITGPQFWNYTGLDGNPDTVFQLEICIPIEKTESPVSENTGFIEGFNCASLWVKGSWSNLKPAYEKLISEMVSHSYLPGKYCREVYHEVDFQNPENCLTEIQMGIN